MIAKHLDGDTLCRALVSGVHNVIADQSFLNSINVFPVADGDTGTNLSLSMGATLSVLEKPGEKQAGTLLEATADALLDGARGNSGAIMAQFFQGVSDATGDLNRLTTAAFSRAVRAGSDYAHDALSNPKEGTILSVIAEFADHVEDAVRATPDGDFKTLISAALPRLDRALKKTTGQLDALRKADVVDAGARGFVDFVKGMAQYLSHGKIVARPDMSELMSADAADMPALSGDAYEYRYCTECIVTGREIDRRKLREALAALGDSLVLAGSKRKAKIHIHVNDAQAVFEIGRRFGEVRGEKADDLQRQQESSHRGDRNFAVITDSAADIADSDMERLDIHMVPCRIQFGHRGYLDKVSITTREFYELLESDGHHPTTSQPAPGDFRRQYQYLANHFDHVISVNLTSVVSGTFEAARSAASRTEASGTVHVIDSLNASLGQGLLAIFAAECGAARVPVAATMEALEALIPQTHTYAVLGNLDYAVRGGRLAGWVRALASILRLIPIIQSNSKGEIKMRGCLLGRSNVPARFASYVAGRIRHRGAQVVATGHAVSPEKAAEIEKILREKVPGIKRMSSAELGTALGVHGGPGTLVIATQPYVNPATLAG